MVQIVFQQKEITDEINAKLVGMQRVLLDFANAELPVVNDIARETILGGVGDPSLSVASGKTKKMGLSVKKISSRGRRIKTYAGGSYWSNMTNLHDNFKERKKLGLLKKFRVIFENDSEVKAIFESSMNDFDKVK